MKSQLRKQLLTQRKSITRDDILEKSKLIENNLFNFERFIKSKSVMFFASFGREVFTHKMITRALKNKTVLIPKIFGENLLPCKISSIKDFHKGPYGAPEPKDEEFFSVKKLDIVIVPALAFTERGERIGYGKGYFDRFLKKTNAFRIGLCFDEFVIDFIDTQEHDLKVDAIVTDKRVIVVDK